MMRFTAHLVLGIILLFSSCTLNQKSGNEVFREKSERETLSEIYSQTLAYEVGNYCSNKKLNISSKTTNYLALNFRKDDWEWVSFHFPSLQQVAWENLLKTNAKSIAFPSDLDLGCDYGLLESEQQPVSSLLSCTDTYEFSQVGFDDDRNQALVFLIYSCGDFSYGNLYYLELIDGKWKAKDVAEAFIT